MINKNFNMTSGDGKRWVSFISKNPNNFKIEYKIEEKVYVVSRVDEEPFNGTEEVGAEFYGNMKKPETLDEMIEHEVNALASIQIEPEVSLFNEFDWAYNENKTKIIVYPVFLDKALSIQPNVPELEGVQLSFSTIKRIRYSDISLRECDCKKLNLKKEN